ncbi:126_t:CDS:2, partial [Cetraspora pellucida]
QQTQQTVPMEETIEQPPTTQQESPPTRPRHKRGPSVVDLAPTYNIADDLLQQKSNATYAQILQISKKRRNLAQALKRPLTTPVKETNLADPKLSSRTTTAKCYVQIQNNSILAVLNSGAAVSIMSKGLARKLGLTIKEPSNTVIVIANGTRERMLGKLLEIKLIIRDLMVPTSFQVIENSDEMLLLRMEWFQKEHAQLHFDEKKLFLRYSGKNIEVPIYQTREDKIELSQDYGSDEDDFFDNYKEENIEEVESYHIDNTASEGEDKG